MSTDSKEAATLPNDVQRAAEAARDALSDEMIGRLAGTAGDAVNLLDQITRSGIGRAIPILAQMVQNGDFQRLAQLARVYGSAEDALTDEMIGRIGEAVSGGLSLLDQVQRSGVEKALPTVARMAADGDLERLAQLARVYGSAQDALTDEMVGRIAETVAAGFSLLDRLNRGGAFRIVQALERLEASGSLERLASSLPLALERLDTVTGLLESLEAASRETAAAPPSTGGIGNMWKLLTDSDTQQTLRFLLSVGRHMRSRGSKV